MELDWATPPDDLTTNWLLDVEVELREDVFQRQVDVRVVNPKAAFVGWSVGEDERGRQVGHLCVRDSGPGRELHLIRAVVVKGPAPRLKRVPLPTNLGRLVGRLETRGGTAWYAFVWQPPAPAREATPPQARGNGIPTRAELARAIDGSRPPREAPSAPRPPDRVGAWSPDDQSQGTPTGPRASATNSPRPERNAGG